MRHTDFLNLNLPEDTDPVEIGDLSENFETIDTSLSAGGGIPAGGIIIWSGAADAVPPGWALCDGTNNTPDLRDRFVLGAGLSYAVDETGGEKSHTLTVKEMPSHSHVEMLGSGANRTTYLSGSISSGTAVKHSKVIPSDSYVGNPSVSTGTAGSPSAHSIMPPYYVLCYIMKI